MVSGPPRCPSLPKRHALLLGDLGGGSGLQSPHVGARPLSSCTGHVVTRTHVCLPRLSNCTAANEHAGLDRAGQDLQG